MRITHVLYLRESPGSNPLSGAENHLWTLLPALARAGANVELVAVLLGSGDFPIVMEKLQQLGGQGVSVTVLRQHQSLQSLGVRFGLITTWFDLWRCLRKRRDRIVHIHLEFKYTPFVAWAAGCRRIVFSLHNDLPVYRMMAGGLWFRLLHRVVREYIAISEGVRAYFLETSGAEAERIHTIYYGMNPVTAAPHSKADCAIPEGRYVVGFVGRLTEQKNLLVLLQAFRERPELFCVLVGAGPQREELERYVMESGMKNVHFLGAIQDAHNLMQLFDVLCLPSLWEGLGLVLLEAMLQGVPIIGSNRGAIPDILGNGRYGVVCEPTVQGITSALDYAVANQATLTQQAAVAKDYALKRFSVDRMTAETLAVYRSATDTM